MEATTKAQAWVQVPGHPRWGFHKPRPELIKIPIDLRSKERRPASPAPVNQYGPSLSSLLAEHRAPRVSGSGHSRPVSFMSIKSQQKSQSDAQNTSKSDVPEVSGKENERPPSLQKKPFHPFGSRNANSDQDRYFGGPIWDMSLHQWRRAMCTRAGGDIIGATESQIPLPPHMKQIVRSVGIMSSDRMTQSGIWIGPRLFLSTLHLHHWVQGFPSNEECELMRKTGQCFDVETEIYSQVLSEFSPKVEPYQFSANDDIGIFKLQEKFPRVVDWIEGFTAELTTASADHPGRRIACVAYNGKIDDEDARRIVEEAAIKLQRCCPSSTAPIDVNSVTKPGMRSFAQGTLDKAEGTDEHMMFGVSSSLWKGSSGGPCVLLDGFEGGAIIGLVRGYELLSDPFNSVNGFPTGLKAAIREYL